MDIASFFNSWPGMYFAQSFLHSLIAAIIVDTALVAWKIENPRVRQRFRLLVVIVPIVAFPLYQAISSERGSALFRLEAMFDMNRWLNLELWGTVPVGVLFLLLLAFSAIIFLVQELAPIMRHRGSETGFEAQPPQADSLVEQALEGIPGERPTVLVLDDPEPVIFSSTGRQPAVYVSHGLLQTFTEPELRAALAHEIGHIRRSRRPAMVLIFLLRVFMFFNPVILMEFRRIVQEEEKICDDFAIAMTGDKNAMAGALRKLFIADDEARTAHAGEPQRLHDRIEEHSHTLLIESRLTRLEGPRAPEAKEIVVFCIVLTTIGLVNFYVV
jgi:Zn-dependent protease with chaperone function